MKYCGGRLRICRRRTCRDKVLLAREGACRRRNTRRGVVPGPQALPPALLPMAQGRGHHRRSGRGAAGERTVLRAPLRPEVRVTVPRRRSRSCRSGDEREDGVANLFRQRLVVKVRQDTPPNWRDQSTQEDVANPTQALGASLPVFELIVVSGPLPREDSP